MTYCNVYTNMVGEDRAEALRVIEDDEKFDRWLQDFDRKQQMRSTRQDTTSGRKKRPANISKEEFLARTGGIYG